MTLGRYPTPVDAPAPSPLDPTPQNDFREQRVSSAEERATWHERRAAHATPATVEPMVELSPDDWTPITIPVGQLGVVALRFLGDDPARRSVVLVNIGTEILLLGNGPDAFNGVTIVPSVFVMPVGASLTLTTTNEVWVCAVTGAAGGISALIERGARRA